MKKADKDKDEVVDFEEFVKETPKVTLCQPRRKVRPVNSVSSRGCGCDQVLRVNLVKLAKRNGHDLGFLV